MFPTLSFKFPERPQRNFEVFSATSILAVPACPLSHGKGAEVAHFIVPHSHFQISGEDPEKL